MWSAEGQRDHFNVDTTVKCVADHGHVIRAIRAGSLADLLYKTIYLWPRSWKGAAAIDELDC